MDSARISLARGTLWSAMLRQTRRALRRGALRPIATRQETVVDGGVRFLVRVVSSLARKDEDRRLHAHPSAGLGTQANPFLPHDPELFVADISDTHQALLNKFNVLDHHLLIVTRAFEDQETLLTIRDFTALWVCMAEYEALGFYNGGTVAGASQRHKHLQMVPLPLAPGGPDVPIRGLLDAVPRGETIGRVPGLPFAHAFCWLPSGMCDDPAAAARTSGALYRALLDASGLGTRDRLHAGRQSGPYNLLVTRRWMLLVPRSQECVAGVSVNALGFAGSLFVRNAEQMETVKRRGPMAVLTAAGLAGS
jgi:sulfate adenylyltransferase (ADP) / ATP adenylyltransferase